MTLLLHTAIQFTLLFSAFTTLIAQTISETLLFDSLAKKPIAFASVHCGDNVTYSDSNGIFTFSEYNRGDTCRISRLGYEPMSIPRDAIEDTLYMVSRPYILPEAEVSANFETLEVGYHRKPAPGKSIQAGSSIVAVCIPWKNDPAIVREVLVRTSGNKKGNVFGVYFFEIVPGQLPGALIHKETFVDTEGKNKLTISLQKELAMPEGGLAVGIRLKNKDELLGRNEGFAIRHKSFTLGEEQEFPETPSFFFSANQWFWSTTPQISFRYAIGLKVELIR